jgi:D-arabinose 1-dehydrogenase-like Zn-dependent alcohol dehydrogenase
MACGNRVQLPALFHFVAEHDIDSLIDRAFAFAEAPAAFDYLGTSDHIGKVVIAMP